MVAAAVRTRVSTGLSMSLASNPELWRTTSSVCVSLTLRTSSLMSPSEWESLIASPGLKKSRLWRMPGRARMAARSDLFSDMRRKMGVQRVVSTDDTSMKAATLACCSGSGGGVGAMGASEPAGAAAGDRSATTAGARSVLTQYQDTGRDAEQSARRQ